jgi:threonyl-tRNA synthetase
VIPVKSEFLDFSTNLATKLTGHSIRADIDDRDESVDRRVRDAELSWIPYVVVVGKKELASDQLAVRRRIDGKQYNCGLADLVKEIVASTEGYPRMPLKLPLLVSERPGYKQVG